MKTSCTIHLCIFFSFFYRIKQAKKKSLQASITSDQYYMEKLMCAHPKMKRQASTSDFTQKTPAVKQTLPKSHLMLLFHFISEIEEEYNTKNYFVNCGFIADFI